MNYKNYLFTLSVLFFICQSSFSQTILNGDFSAGSANWTHCSNGVETNPETAYGGSNSSNRVAEVDGHTNSSSTSDDRELCQTISGFTVGNTYELVMFVSRRNNAPASVSAGVTIDGGALNETVTRTNVDFAFTATTFQFTATQTEHTLHITSGISGSLGIIFDNISLAALLPVELSSFEATESGCKVDLNWTVESAYDFSHFELERSTDGRNFTTISKIKGENVDSHRLYEYTDNGARSENFYRLKEVDIDGSYSYSKTISAKLKNCGENASGIKVYPTLVKSFGQVSIEIPTPTGNEEVLIIDGRGQLVESKNIEPNGELTTFNFSLENFAPGMYFVKNSNGETARFIVTD